MPVDTERGSEQRECHREDDDGQIPDKVDVKDRNIHTQGWIRVE